MTLETTMPPQEAPAIAAPPAETEPDEEDQAGLSASGGNYPAPKSRGAIQPRTIYGSFWLENTEFALHADIIKEVVKEPETITAVPLSPAFMLGLFNLRGRIIPIVDLRMLLEFPGCPPPERKVAIIEDGEHCIGLLVDRTGEVLNAHGVARVDFGARQGKPKDVAVEGLLKFEDGKRIVQILDPCELLSLKRVPRAESLTDEAAQAAKASRGPQLNCLSFQFGHTICAIDLRDVIEVMDAPEIMESVLVSDCFIGITNVRGRVIPVADFRNFMGDSAKLKNAAIIPSKRKILIIDTEGGQVGLLVYSIDSIVRCFNDEILEFTKLALPREDIVRGCLVSKDHTIVLLLDHTVMKRDPILVDTAQRCNEIHPAEQVEIASSETGKASARMTFIVFSVDKPFALDTAQVSEVIDYPKKLLQPPYAVDCVDGIVDLRGELISLINPRKLYKMPTPERVGRKVLIFKQAGSKYGLVVDSVDEIVYTKDSDVGDIGSLSHESRSMQVADDISGCVQSPARGSVMILDVNSVLGRCFETVSDKEMSSAHAV